MAHGGGGRLMQQLLEKIFFQAFDNPILAEQQDSAILKTSKERLALTTDSYVISPLFFPGGDIGSLAVHGTVNDLAVSGARPLYLSASFILEEGLPMETLWKIACSMRKAADRAGVLIVTGDTKVVERGKGDGIFITTTGLGVLDHPTHLSPREIQPGDGIILNGDLGRHGMAIMAAREGLEFESTLESDSAPLNHLITNLIQAEIPLHCMRDLTRGGLASILVELAEASHTLMEIEEKEIPVGERVQGACEILGLDPLYVANEGRVVFFIPENAVAMTLSILQQDPLGKDATLIGRVIEKTEPEVRLKTKIGVARRISRLSGEQLPRIC
ncbi:MAG: hydrogenase expression/formation protein HypE [bacterium]|nr:hydrogenase expression/formation protein HypE [bacterium]